MNISESLHEAVFEDNGLMNLYMTASSQGWDKEEMLEAMVLYLAKEKRKLVLREVRRMQEEADYG